MTRTLIGFDYTGVACVKVTKLTYDPKTTADSLRDRFYFSSKWKDQVENPFVEMALYAPYNGERFVIQPTGATKTNFTRYRYDVGNPIWESQHWYRSTRFPDLRYLMPMVDLKEKNRATGRFTHGKLKFYLRGDDGPNGAKGGYLGWTERSRGMWCRAFVNDYSGELGFSMSYGTRAVEASGDSSGATSGMTDRQVVVWNLPGDDTPLDGDATPPSAAGKMTVQITKDYCRVAKPGFDVRTALPQQLAFDTSGRPLGVIAAADVAVPAGTSSFDTGVDLPTDAVCEISFYTGTALYYPARPSNDDQVGADYAFIGTRIYFYNPYAACRARFIIFAAGLESPTSGTNNVLKQITDNGEKHVQFIRPGAGASPTVADIILDTRRPVLQLLKEGYYQPPTATAHEHTISYDATGFFPYIKFATHHGAGSMNNGNTTWAEGVREPLVKVLQPGSAGYYTSGDTAYCVYDDQGATFRTSKSRAVDRYYSSGGSLINAADPCPILGIRYYVFGIPL
jgi:hypothetical protein